MPARPTDEELAQALGEEYDRQEADRRNSQTMNALLRGHRESDEEQEQEQDDDKADAPADFNAVIRRDAGRPYNRKKTEEK